MSASPLLSPALPNCCCPPAPSPHPSSLSRLLTSINPPPTTRQRCQREMHQRGTQQTGLWRACWQHRRRAQKVGLASLTAHSSELCSFGKANSFCTHEQTNAHAHTHTHMYVHTHIHTNTPTHAHTRPHTNKHTHTSDSFFIPGKPPPEYSGPRAPQGGFFFNTPPFVVRLSYG